MKTINIHIKNMVCSRCIWAVEEAFRSLKVSVLHIEMGCAIVKIPNTDVIDSIDTKLRGLGFERLENKEEIIINQLKAAITGYLELMENFLPETSLSEYLSRKIGKNYNYLSKLFSRHESQTIEAFYINKRIDRVKELLGYDQLTLSEIAAKMNYSSVHYLSSQFKKVTGFSVSEFKQRLEQKEQAQHSIKKAFDSLIKKGFVYNFNKGEDCFECEDLCTSFTMEEVQIKEEYRFEPKNDNRERSVVYSVQTKDGLKGVLLETLNGHPQTAQSQATA